MTQVKDFLTIEFRTANDAFQDGQGPHEINRILCKIGQQILDGQHAGIIRDINGNTIGNYWSTPED